MINFAKKETRKLVLVLGANRSGTSLLMQLLCKMGLQVSTNLVPANFSNTEGFFEDADVVNVHTALYECLNTQAYLPLPDKWLGTECAKNAKSELKRLIAVSLEKSNKIFGIKDPRTSNFLPLWTSIFNELSLIPVFILAIRQPAQMVASFTRQYSASHNMAELTWLLRTIEALENTAGDCFIVHYEDWFTNPVPLANNLLCYTGLNQSFDGDLSNIFAETVNPILNRVSKNDYEIQNPYVIKLYDALKECRGANFDHDRLMAVVKECRQAMEGFKSWYLLAQQANKKVFDIQKQLEKSDLQTATIKSLETRIQTLEKEIAKNIQLAEQLPKLQQQLNQLMNLS